MYHVCVFRLDWVLSVHRTQQNLILGLNIKCGSLSRNGRNEMRLALRLTQSVLVEGIPMESQNTRSTPLSAPPMLLMRRRLRDVKPAISGLEFHLKCPPVYSMQPTSPHWCLQTDCHSNACTVLSVGNTGECAYVCYIWVHLCASDSSCHHLSN